MPAVTSAILERGRRSDSTQSLWSDTEALWQHSRNAVGIARLLLHEQRPTGLLDTACRAAMDYACRAALRAAGETYPGDLTCSLEMLAAPCDLVGEITGLPEGAASLAAAERVLAWVSLRLRRSCPHRSWRC